MLVYFQLHRLPPAGLNGGCSSLAYQSGPNTKTVSHVHWDLTMAKRDSCCAVSRIFIFSPKFDYTIRIIRIIVSTIRFVFFFPQFSFRPVLLCRLLQISQPLKDLQHDCGLFNGPILNLEHRPREDRKPIPSVVRQTYVTALGLALWFLCITFLYRQPHSQCFRRILT